MGDNVNWDNIMKDYELRGEGPFYTDYLYNVQASYPNAGIGATNWGDGTDIPYLYAHKVQIVEYFNMKYKLREIGAETESRWQMLVDMQFNKVKRVYNHWFMLYETNEIETLGKVMTEHFKLDRNSKVENVTEGSTSSEQETVNSSKYQDMPIQQYIEAGNYATNITDGTGKDTAKGSSETIGNSEVETTDEYNREKNDNDKSILEYANQNAEMWTDLINAFVDEFANCFINEIARI